MVGLRREEFLELFIYGRNILISHYTSLLIKLSVVVIKEALRRGIKVEVLDRIGTLVKYIPEEVLQGVVIRDELGDITPSSNLLLVVNQPDSLRGLAKCGAENILVLLTPGRVHRLANFTKIYLSRLQSGNIFKVKCYSRGINLLFTFVEGDVKVIEAPPGIYGEAYEVLKSAMSTYGELTVKDATLVLYKELGVDKRRARAILVYLARRCYIKVVKGRINLV